MDVTGFFPFICSIPRNGPMETELRMSALENLQLFRISLPNSEFQKLRELSIRIVYSIFSILSKFKQFIKRKEIIKFTIYAIQQQQNYFSSNYYCLKYIVKFELNSEIFVQQRNSCLYDTLNKIIRLALCNANTSS